MFSGDDELATGADVDNANHEYFCLEISSGHREVATGATTTTTAVHTPNQEYFMS